MSGSAGVVFHVMNRGARRLTICDRDDDYRLLLGALAEAHDRVAVDVFAYCLMPNHFHLLVRPTMDGQLAEFMRLATVIHSVRWHHRRRSQGTGCVYQGRYKAFAVQSNRYFLNACSYVEANALRSSLVERAEDSPWSSASARRKNCKVLPLCEWPILQPPDWLEIVNQRHSRKELSAIRRSIRRSRPFGEESWTHSVSTLLGRTSGRPPGRPRKDK